jgi:hypothetical protein
VNQLDQCRGDGVRQVEKTLTLLGGQCSSRGGEEHRKHDEREQRILGCSLKWIAGDEPHEKVDGPR